MTGRIPCLNPNCRCTAVHIMPPESELIDEADMYNMWGLSIRLPFTLARRAA